jgi:hypothetical protein
LCIAVFVCQLKLQTTKKKQGLYFKSKVVRMCVNET